MGPLGELNEVMHKYLALDKCRESDVIINKGPVTNILPLQLELCHSQKERSKWSSVLRTQAFVVILS